MKIVALAGGVGGAKFAHGLAQILPPQDLTIVVNTGDDFEHLGLYICPDLDTVCYTLAGLANPDTGWGRVNETWSVMTNLARLGSPDWFQLGDSDLATHLVRTQRIQSGQPLSRITGDFCRSWGVRPTVLPMCDQPVRTLVHTLENGTLAFQEYFVKLNCQPHVCGFHFEGVESAQPSPGVVKAIEQAQAVIICPSNPWVSIDPILAVNGIKSGMTGKKVVAISPIIGGKTIKGPAAKMYSELGMQPSALSVAKHYQGLANGFVLDKIDALLELDIRQVDLQVLVTNTVMSTSDERRRLAEDVLHFIRLLE